ncbi:Imm6 family immunity protein [Psychrobacter sp. I-STPA6b]|uniref:Imm6 family immunity protein n=1 Tax=Psychrobacter sp. I-STPA6b TaxID=2585718 RepID=UPI001D0C72B3|nr:Imm6 family immunity protein [Psychrobacter sp. I-STPA6b]
MLYNDFILLNDINKAEALLYISNIACKELENNTPIYSQAKTALFLSEKFIKENFQNVDAIELSSYLNNPDEKKDLGMLICSAKNKKEQLALDVIIYTVGFISKIAHEKTKTTEKMPEPVVEASADVVYNAFKSYSEMKRIV